MSRLPISIKRPPGFRTSKLRSKASPLRLFRTTSTPAPPVGTALGPHGLNLGEFCTKFNAATKDKAGLIIPVLITVYQDKSFTFEIKTPPAAYLLKQAVKITSGSKAPGRDMVGTVTMSMPLAYNSAG